MRCVTSFDIFDTIVARRVRQPTDIFSLMEHTASYPGFAQLRQTAQDRSNQTFTDIYAQFQQITQCSDADRDRLAALEIQTEIDNLYLIQRIANMVKEGDLLVSDMYHTEETLRHMLEAVGFHTNVDLFVSPSGKASGQAWAQLRTQYTILHHYGDNAHSDVHMAQQYGIPATHVTVSSYTPAEDVLHSASASFAAQIRALRLSNPYAVGSWQGDLFDEQIDHNLPFLMYVSHRIAVMARERQVRRLFFTTRDCCLLQKVFACMHPSEFEIVTFQASRLAYDNASDDYVRYVESSRVLEDDSMVVDLYASFRSLQAFFQKHFGHNPKTLSVNRLRRWVDQDAGIMLSVDKMTWIWDGVTTEFWESLNADNCGTLITVDADGTPLRAPPDHDVDMSMFMHAVIDNVLTHLPVDLPVENEESWRRYIRTVLQCSRIRQYVCNNDDHESLTQIANACQTDKGTTYRCAHGYASTYERVVGYLLLSSPPRKHHPFHLLEIGLNRDDTSSTPSISMWRKYFYKRNLEIFGFDIQAAFLAFHDPSRGIHILHGDQSDPISLQQCHGRLYDFIIDDGSHMSSHQQITLASLWSCVRPGGCYAIEDLHYQPLAESCIKTKDLVREWKSGNWISTPHIPDDVVQTIAKECARIDMIDSQSKDPHWNADSLKGALALLWKIETT